MRKVIEQNDFGTYEFHDIDLIIHWLNRIKEKGATHIDFTGYSNVVKCRALKISKNDNLIMDEDDIV